MTRQAKAVGAAVTDAGSQAADLPSEDRIKKDVSSPDLVFDQVLRGLYTGRYVPGQRLVEADLTREYKVSRGSIREALRRLAAEGVVSLSLYRGAYIRSLTRDEVRQVLAVVEVLTGLAARLATERIDEGDNRKMFLERFEELMTFEAHGDFLDFVRARDRFYRGLVRMGRNPELTRVLPSMHVHLVRIQFRGYSTAAEERRFADYREIAAAVLAGSPKRAEAATRRHIRNVLTGIERLPDEAFASPE